MKTDAVTNKRERAQRKKEHAEREARESGEQEAK
jgi:hypothetical protein